MPEIKIKVRDKCAEGEGVIICNNSDYTVVWDLDNEWEPYSAKTMRVNLADGTYQDVVFTGNTAALPVLSTPGWVSVGLYAGDLHTSRAARLLALSSVLTPGGPPCRPCGGRICADHGQTQRAIYRLPGRYRPGGGGLSDGAHN